MYNFLKRVSAGLPRAGKSPSSSTPGRRTRLSIERLEERLALSSFPNLMGGVFLLQDPTGKNVAVLTIVTENRHTGAFTATFLDKTATNHLNTLAPGTGQINRPHHKLASITFNGTGTAGAPPAIPIVLPGGGVIHVPPGEIQVASLTGSIKGAGHKMALTASLTVQDIFFSGSVIGPVVTNVPTQVTGHV